MPDIPRSTDYFLNATTGVLKDNTAGDIGANDVRDLTLSAYRPQGVCDFRLGLEQDVGVSTADQAAKSVIYVNAIGFGDRLGLYDGTSWTLFNPQPFALAGLTGLTADRNYDVFVDFSTPTHSSTNTTTDVVTWSANPGWTTGAYVIVTATGGGLTEGTHYWYNRASATTGSFHTTLANAIANTGKVNLTANITQTLIGIYADLGPTWNAGAVAGSDTARGTGAGSTSLATVGGAFVNAVSATGAIGGGTIAANNGLFMGTTRTTATTTVEDSVTRRFLWNNFNRAHRRLVRADPNATWTQGAGSVFRQANGSSANQVEGVVGQTGPTLHLKLIAAGRTSATAQNLFVGIGEDNTTALDPQCIAASIEAPGEFLGTLCAALTKAVGLGYHAWTWLERGSSTNDTLWEGDNVTPCGMTGWLEG